MSDPTASPSLTPGEPSGRRPGDAAPSELRRQAADWHARLSRLSVQADDLRAFRAWRAEPAHAAAYDAVQAAWEAAGGLAGDPDIAAATAAALARRPARPAAGGLARRGPALALAGLGAGAVAAALMMSASGQPFGRAYATGVGEQRLVVLEDGSRVRLNTDSRIRVRFRAGERRISLTRGEALFEAAHDPARPFVVDAGLVRVRALGTTFDVWRRPAEVQVALLEGQVRVAQGARQAVLAPDQQLRATKAGLTAPVSAEPAEVAGWTSGRLTFRGHPLAAAVAEVNRYGRRPVVLEAPQLAARPVSGVFEAGDTDEFVAAVAALFDLQVDATPRAIRLRPRPGAAASNGGAAA